ncbi:hypothetical protein crov436 [Cafeteria roenbergensis virus]|uniref:Uncharacterized protein n=1 Tax=Cafeteria roenbergensis virus (strain BV-PW1) TaxID=693272 RepID=E3T5K7_CROVB|nr:hypothetical protein crov436 [Cafeteria roenbergensis virus BV-PW1]ADO67470.1 hypothetical protein crov436 [Cafeteria roenbergensis virus BV-PW1]
MKNIIAIVILIGAVSIFLSKKLELYSSWKKTPATITSVKKILNNKKLGEIRYTYLVNNKEYTGSLLQKIINNELIIPKKMHVYYHWLNPELSVKSIPINFEDILLLLTSIIGCLYLYFYSCESCISEGPIPVLVDSIKIIS